MKQLTTALCTAAVLTLSLPVFASDAADCHFHGSAAATRETVSGCAVRHQQKLVAGGKVDKSWLAIKPSTLEQIDGQRGKEWKVMFKDPAAADKTKEILYMFLTVQGNLIAANFTGK